MGRLMKFPIGLLLVAIGPGLFAANVIPPGTGGPNWTIVYDDLTEEPMGGGAAVVVTKLGNGWGTALPGTSWIGPAADQSNNTSPQVRPGTCCRGSVTYKLDFDVADPASEALAISFYADDKVTVYLNGNVIYTGGAYNKIVTLQVTSGFVQGANYFHFDVDNSTGGPTGLDVSFAAPAVTTSLNQSSAPGKYHLDAVLDPVDSGSGQFYETETDIDLGGPMGLAFKRYYSSQLSSTGATTALGTNWMSNFDAKAVVSGTNAKVLLFGGLVVSFTNSGGAWQLVSPKQTQYQFQASGSNYLLLDPDANRIYTFSSTGALTQISDRRGNSITVGASQISDGLGRTIALTYTNGVLTQLADQSGRKVVFAYSGGTLASVIDVYNQTTKYTYTGAALMTARQLPLGNIPTSQTYDSQGRVVTQTDANNHVTKISYDGTGGTTITDPAGNVTKHVNDFDRRPHAVERSEWRRRDRCL